MQATVENQTTELETRRHEAAALETQISELRAEMIGIQTTVERHVNEIEQKTATIEAKNA